MPSPSLSLSLVARFRYVALSASLFRVSRILFTHRACLFTLSLSLSSRRFNRRDLTSDTCHGPDETENFIQARPEEIV